LNAQCSTALPDDIFSQLHAAVAGIQTGREQTVKDISSTNCLSSNQIGLFAALLTNDQEKYNYLTFAKPYCADPYNYINLSSHINDARLKNMFQNSQSEQNIQTQNQQVTNPPVRTEFSAQQVQINQATQTQTLQSINNTATVPAQQVAAQPLVHSPMNGYSGRVGCENISSDAAFGVLEQKLGKQSFESDKINSLKQELPTLCISTAQLSKVLKMFVHESNKLEAAKIGLNSIHDIDNYPSLHEEFTFKSSQQELLNHFINNAAKLTKKAAITQKSNYNGTKGCQQAMSMIEFDNLYKTSKIESFDNKRTEIISNFISKNCLSVDQIEKLAQLYSFDNYKLDFLKFAYSKTFDLDNFKRLESLFSFDSYKRDFNKIMINGKLGK
jgi:hypothetical protein